MKAARLVIMALISVSMIAVGIFTVIQLSSKEPPKDMSSSQQTEDSTNASDLPLSIESEVLLFRKIPTAMKIKRMMKRSKSFSVILPIKILLP